MPKYLLAHDLGTSGNKATLFTVEGELVNSVVYPYQANYFNSNYAEQNPDDWWKAVCRSTKALLSDVNKEDVLAVSFSGQMMGCLCVGRDGLPLRDSIIWADMRAKQQEEYLCSKILPEKFYRIVGHRISSSYSLEKLMWLKDNEPDVYKKTYKMLNAKDYIVHRMTGRFLTDYSDASSTNALDLNTFKWSEEIIEAAGIEFDKLPELVASTYIAGEITKENADECGLCAGTKVVMGGGDGVCASVGAGSISEGLTYNCLGSSSWICTASKKPVFDKKMRTFNWAHIVPGFVAPCGTMQTAGAAFSWLKNEICTYETEQARNSKLSPYEYINEAIEKSSPGANGLIFLPYLLGERTPRWNPSAKGAFIGLKMEHKREDILRSVIEGIGLNLKIILNIFKEVIDIHEITAVGGLAKGNIQRQIFADVFGINVLSLNYIEEASAMGAAVTAGVAIGELRGFEDVGRFIKVKSVNKPIKENTDIYQRLMPVFEKAYFSLEDVFADMAKL